MAIANGRPRQPDTLSAARRHKSLAIIAAAALVLLNTLLHAQIYGVRDYREDEIVVLHISNLFTPTELAQHMASDTHPPGWQLFIEVWIEAFGDGETLTRWLSKLINLITFALVYQFGKQICCKRVGLYAIVLLGVYGFASNAMYELRPYSMLIMLVTALHLLFYRWMQKPTFRLMFAYVAAGIAVIYTHFFSIFIFPAHAVLLVLLTRYERKLWLKSLLIWLFIGLSFLGWVLPFLQAIFVVMPGGIYYAIPPGWEGIELYYQGSKFTPDIVFHLLMLLALFCPWLLGALRRSNNRMRFDHRFVVLYPLFLLVLTISIAYAADSVVRSFSQRNLVMFAPLVVMCMALGLRLLPNIAGLLLVALLILNAPENIDLRTSNAPYREIVQEMSANYMTDSLVVSEFDWAWRWLLPAAYYLMDFTPDKMSKTRMFHLVEPSDSAHPPNYSDELINIHKAFDPDSFGSRLPEHQQLWRLQEGGGNDLGGEFESWLNSRYALIRSVSWEEGYETTYSLSEYARAPVRDGPLLEAGASLRLYTWELRSDWDVSACEAVTIESWWQILERDRTPYTISIILADADSERQLAIANQIAPADQFTSDWAPKRYYRDRTSIVIPCDIRSGSYDLLLAGKESLSGEPLRLAYPSGDIIGREYYLTTLNVLPS